jgi:hypothetical protein
MTDEQILLLRKAEESLRAAKLLAENALYDFAASRAYYNVLHCSGFSVGGKGYHTLAMLESFQPSDNNSLKPSVCPQSIIAHSLMRLRFALKETTELNQD